MSIWRFEDTSRDPELVSLGDCPFCKARPESAHNKITAEPSMIDRRGPVDFHANPSERPTVQETVAVCKSCGWWVASKYIYSPSSIRPFEGTDTHMGACASLRELDLTDINIPIQEARDYLIGRYEDRFDVHPRKFEEVVCDVFRSLGYMSAVTAYSGDGGIDVILQDGSKQIGIQVKRYRNSISVEQIRSLAGALVIGGYTKGMFVTTSKFQSGAAKTSEKARAAGYQIDLIDGDRFFDMLGLAQSSLPRKMSSEEINEILSNLRYINSTTTSLFL